MVSATEDGTKRRNSAWHELLVHLREKYNMHCNVPSGILEGGINYDDKVPLLPMMMMMVLVIYDDKVPLLSMMMMVVVIVVMSMMMIVAILIMSEKYLSLPLLFSPA